MCVDSLRILSELSLAVLSVPSPADRLKSHYTVVRVRDNVINKDADEGLVSIDEALCSLWEFLGSM